MKKSKYFLLLILILVLAFSCSTTKKNTIIYPRYSLVNIENKEIKNVSIDLNYIRGTKEYMEFMIYIDNNSSDTIDINPSIFYYKVENKNLSDTISFENHFFCMDPDRTLAKLSIEKDTLLKSKNPYLLSTKTTKEILKEGLIKGSIWTALGLDPKNIEKERKRQEDEWYENQENKITEVDKQITFWQKDALKHHKLLPYSQCSGVILFPPCTDNLIGVFLPFNNRTYHYTYKISE